PARTRISQWGRHYPTVTSERRPFAMPAATPLRRRHSAHQKSARRRLSAKIRSAAPPRRRQTCNLRAAICRCVGLLALPSCWFFHVALQFAGRRLRIRRALARTASFGGGAAAPMRKSSLARRVRALAICPNFLEIGLRFLKQDHGRFAVFSAVMRE